MGNSTQKYSVPANDILITMQCARTSTIDQNMIREFLTFVPDTTTYEVTYNYLPCKNKYRITKRYTEYTPIKNTAFKILHFISCADIKPADCLGLTKKQYDLYQQILNFVNPTEKTFYMELTDNFDQSLMLNEPALTE